MNGESNLRRTIASLTVLGIVHGAYLFLTGLWPIIHMESFVAVTGPKTDYWLVRTVGMLAFFIGSGLLIAGIKKHIPFPLIVIAAGSALGFLLIDIIYVLENVLWPIYLLDAGAELVFLVAWIVLTYQSGDYELFYEKRA
jgi:hypothetical protein